MSFERGRKTDLIGGARTHVQLPLQIIPSNFYLSHIGLKAAQYLHNITRNATNERMSITSLIWTTISIKYNVRGCSKQAIPHDVTNTSHQRHDLCPGRHLEGDKTPLVYKKKTSLTTSAM